MQSIDLVVLDITRRFHGVQARIVNAQAQTQTHARKTMHAAVCIYFHIRAGIVKFKC